MKLLKFFKTILKSIIVAFSVYSKIPMPKFEWASDDMKYHLCFFPWVGALIAVLEWILYCFFQAGTFSKAFFVLFALALPLLVTMQCAYRLLSPARRTQFHSTCRIWRIYHSNTGVRIIPLQAALRIRCHNHGGKHNHYRRDEPEESPKTGI